MLKAVSDGAFSETSRETRTKYSIGETACFNQCLPGCEELPAYIARMRWSCGQRRCQWDLVQCHPCVGASSYHKGVFFFFFSSSNAIDPFFGMFFKVEKTEAEKEEASSIGTRPRGGRPLPSPLPPSKTERSLIETLLDLSCSPN